MKKHQWAILVALVVILLTAAVAPSVALANWCGPNAGTRACLECPLGVNSECNNTTCFAEMPAACQNFTPRTTLVPGSLQAYSCENDGLIPPFTWGYSYATAVQTAKAYEYEGNLCPPYVVKAWNTWGYKVQLRKLAE